MKAAVRLLSMTAPIHDAEFLADPNGELGIDNLVKFAESLDPDLSGWAFIDFTFLIDMTPGYTRDLTQSFHMARISTKPADDFDGGLDAVLVKLSASDLADTFLDVQYDTSVQPLVRDVLGVMWDMVVADFPDVYEDCDPRAVD